MSIVLRLVLVLASLLTVAFVFRKIRKSHFMIGDTLFWIFFGVFLLLLSIFPQISYFCSGILGFESPANFVFITVIFLLIVKIFFLTERISRNEVKLNRLIQKYALDKIEDNERHN